MADAGSNGGREPLFSLRIGGLDYRVSLDPWLIRDEGADGQIQYTTTEIILDESLSDGKRLQVLLHEILHGLINHAGAKDVFADESACERCIEVLSHGIVQVLRDNPVIGEMIRSNGGEMIRI